jgi:hypothetical protein
VGEVAPTYPICVENGRDNMINVKNLTKMYKLGNVEVKAIRTKIIDAIWAS